MSNKPFHQPYAAQALRNAGFVPLPRLWVPKARMPEIHAITQEYQHQVNSIRAIARGDEPLSKEELDQLKVENASDPKEDKEAAWAAFEASQRT